MDSNNQKEVAVTVVYDEAVAAAQAMRVLADLTRELGGLTRLRTEIWRFDLLEEWFSRSAALEDAVGADILVIAVHRACALSGDVADWIQWCLRQKAGSTAAIIALFDEAGLLGETESPRNSLRDMVAAAGLDFFSPRWRTSEIPKWSTGQVHSRAEPLTVALDEILHQ